jgi:hypothetical protein
MIRKAREEIDHTPTAVRVTAPFRVVHDGDPYTDGDELTVPKSTADEWISARYVELVTADKPKPVEAKEKS